MTEKKTQSNSNKAVELDHLIASQNFFKETQNGFVGTDLGNDTHIISKIRA